MIKLLPFQIDALKAIEHRKRCAIYYGLGLGKTFIGAEKLMSFDSNIKLVVCQKSKIDDWLDHMETHYSKIAKVYNLRNPKERNEFYQLDGKTPAIGVINYDILSRQAKTLNTLFAMNMAIAYDESSMIKNPTALRTKAALSLKTEEIVLLSGTPVGGKYEELYTQLTLLGWNISYSAFERDYLITNQLSVVGVPFPIKQVVGYKNVDELKAQLRKHGAIFKRSEDVLDLPESVETTIRIPITSEYKRMKKDGCCEFNGDTLMASTPLTKMLYMRQLSGAYNPDKVAALEDLLESTNDRVIIFYNFWEEFNIIRSLCDKLKRPLSFVNGKGSDNAAYEQDENSVTAIQYKSGATGLNLQLANKMIFFSPELSSELFEQAKGRIRRMGQTRTCFYWYLTVDDLEARIYETLKKRADYTLDLFVETYDVSGLSYGKREEL